MEHSSAYVANAIHEHEGGGTKEIWRTFWILLILTIVELGLGYWMIGMGDGGLKHTVKGAIVILMLAKAFYIVGYFMHLKHEVKNLIMTICVPLALLVWAIIAFLYEGNSFRNNKNTYNPHYKEASQQKAEKPEHEKKPATLE